MAVQSGVSDMTDITNMYFPVHRQELVKKGLSDSTTLMIFGIKGDSLKLVWCVLCQIDMHVHKFCCD